MMEVRWHGRGGQGAKTAAQLLAVAFLHEGKSVQAFPEYGPERSGAPMLAYCRVDEQPIRRHCAVTEPDAVVVLDRSLLGEQDVGAGLKPSGVLLVNADSLPGSLRLPPRFRGHVVAVAGDRLAREAGSRYPNTVMLGALAGWLGAPSLAHLAEAWRETASSLPPPAFDAGLRALEAGYRAGERSRAHG